jgi:hypothetical protein
MVSALRTTWLLIATLALWSPAARAQNVSVWLNDVKLDPGSARNLTLNNVDVMFDASGDVHIIAKGYKVSSKTDATATAAAAAAAQPSASKRFFITPMQPQGRTGASQWVVDVYVNQFYVHQFRSKDPEPFFEITKWMKVGTNTIHFDAKKEAGDRISSSPTDYLDLVIGFGELAQGQLMLTKLNTYRRTAAETGGYKSDMTLELNP